MITPNYDSSTSTLTITGTGELTQQSANNGAVHMILKGFTRLSDDCLRQYSSLETIELPDTLLSIGNNAFAGTKIQEIFLPASVREVSEFQAFDDYYELLF